MGIDHCFKSARKSRKTQVFDLCRRGEFLSLPSTILRLLLLLLLFCVHRVSLGSFAPCIIDDVTGQIPFRAVSSLFFFLKKLKRDSSVCACVCVDR